MNAHRVQHLLPDSFTRQRGAVLVVGLIVIAVLLLLALSYSQSAIMQNRLAGNMKDLSVAHEAGEAALRWPSAWIQSLEGNSLSRPFPCTGECDITDKVFALGQVQSRPGPKDSFWDIAKEYGVNPADNISMDSTVPAVASQPRFTIEQQYFRRDDLAGSPQMGVAYYRITALGMGRWANNDTVLRAVVAKRYE